ncbi:MAG TPA: hypothetical protein VIL46_14455, partial [Gemmataceae bacterium]
ADALAALRWLSRMATGEVEGYDIRPVAPALREQLRSPDEQMASLAVRAVRHLPGAEAQQDLANLALDPDRPAPLRAEAARALVDHLQQFGRHLTPTQVRLLAEQAAGAAEGDLRPHLEAVVGIVTGSPAETSRRLLQYTPPAPQPPREPEAPPKEPKAPGM